MPHPALHSPPQHHSPPASLPDELWTDILSHLSWDEIIALRPVSRRFASLAMSPPLHRNMTVHLPFVPRLLPHLLPHVRHLQIELHCLPDYARRPGEWGWCSPAHDLASLLRCIPNDGLLSLSLPGVSHVIQWDVVGPELARIGGRLERLNLRLSGLSGRLWVSQWATTLGTRGNGLRELDLTGTPITCLPDPRDLPNLEKLVLQSCFMLPRRALAAFLADLPPTLQLLDISYLRQVALEDLYAIGVSPALKTVKLVGIDHLTRSDVRALQRHWSDEEECTTPPPGLDYAGYSQDVMASSPESAGPRTPRMSLETVYTPPPSPRHCYSPGQWCGTTSGSTEVHIGSGPYCTPRKNPDKVRIVHSALLETDDEAGYRQFIGEVVNGVRLPYDWSPDIAVI